MLSKFGVGPSQAAGKSQLSDRDGNSCLTGYV